MSNITREGIEHCLAYGNEGSLRKLLRELLEIHYPAQAPAPRFAIPQSDTEPEND